MIPTIEALSFSASDPSIMSLIDLGVRFSSHMGEIRQPQGGFQRGQADAERGSGVVTSPLQLPLGSLHGCQ